MMKKLLRTFFPRIFFKFGPPIHLIWFITGRCNLRCMHCFYHESLDNQSQEFSLNEMKKVIDKLPPLLSLNLTGGEPFLLSDLADIVSYIAERHVTENLVLFTNGYKTEHILKTTEDILSNCPDMHIFVVVSIDGDEEAHDTYRNQKGSYKNAIATIQGFELLKKKYSHFNLGVGMTLHSGNQDIIQELRKRIYQEYGIRAGVNMIRGDAKSQALKDIDTSVYFDVISDIENEKVITKNKTIYQTIVETREVIGQKLAYETFTSGKRSYACYAGSLMGIIYETGDVYPCEMLDEANLGNLRDFEYDVKAVWRTKTASQMRKWISQKKCSCTYECQYTCNTLYNPRFIPYFIKNVLKRLFLR